MPVATITVMKVLKNKVWNCLQERKVVDIGILIPATLPKLIMEVVKAMDLGINRQAPLPQVIAEIVDVGQVLPATLPLVIAEVMLIEVYLVHKISSSLPLSISKK